MSGLNICSHFHSSDAFFSLILFDILDSANHEMMNFFLGLFLLLTQSSEGSLLKNK